MLEFQEVSFQYETGDGDHEALSPLSVTLREGERVAVLGSNGAGKSTFFLLANGVLRPHSGTIRLDGEPIGRRSRDLLRLRRAVGLVFQDPDVQFLAGTVEEEISFGPMNLGLPPDEIRRRVDAAIECLGLDGYRERGPQELSGGEKGRVAIADVLAMEPRFLLLDEPASSLDPAGRALLEQTLGVLHEKGMALAVATHDVDFAWRWADRALVFHQGRLERDAAPAEVFADTALLARCGLEQPLLWRAAAALGVSPPKHPEEFSRSACGGSRSEA
ncbi:energy-coupling factor ABC transporter ATP-binding protein [Anaeromassilibacillus sp. An200]|uniref:energy-coupling factor ABC transporter ATP-binding protein n=1 Tax=Anaeromassilibacillus sp. An200 TaxID=1965587 RepID=UPI000B39C295|nr:ABC transporter ATP-binding protein [Anaeromassilibacillus sp. An200]OUP05804.1 ATP-binding protein [Anaeromassilibacillus sp. An200]